MWEGRVVYGIEKVLIVIDVSFWEVFYIGLY